MNNVEIKLQLLSTQSALNAFSNLKLKCPLHKQCDVMAILNLKCLYNHPCLLQHLKCKFGIYGIKTCKMYTFMKERDFLIAHHVPHSSSCFICEM